MSVALIFAIAFIAVGVMTVLASLAAAGWVFWFAAKNQNRERPWAAHQMSSLEPNH